MGAFDGCVVVFERQGLRIGQRFLQFSREFIYTHGFYSFFD